jgi:hypothetical protein
MFLGVRVLAVAVDNCQFRAATVAKKLGRFPFGFLVSLLPPPAAQHSASATFSSAVVMTPLAGAPTPLGRIAHERAVRRVDTCSSDFNHLGAPESTLARTRPVITLDWLTPGKSSVSDSLRSSPARNIHT